jgi:hypothetical protein
MLGLLWSCARANADESIRKAKITTEKIKTPRRLSLIPKNNLPKARLVFVCQQWPFERIIADHPKVVQAATVAWQRRGVAYFEKKEEAKCLTAIDQVHRLKRIRLMAIGPIPIPGCPANSTQARITVLPQAHPFQPLHPAWWSIPDSTTNSAWLRLEHMPTRRRSSK